MFKRSARFCSRRRHAYAQAILGRRQGPAARGRGLLADLVTAMCGGSACHCFGPALSGGEWQTAGT